VHLQSDFALLSHLQLARSQSAFWQSLHLQLAQSPSPLQSLFLSQHFFPLSQHRWAVSVVDSSANDMTAVHGTKTSAATSAIANPFDIARSP
jgi:hypothetical protein